MNNIEDTLWDHLTEHHGADQARLRPMPPVSRTRPRGPIVAGVVAAGVAAAGGGVLATSAASPGGSSATSSISGRDSAYVLKRVKARLAADSQSSYVTYGVDYHSGRLNTDGSLADLGTRAGWGWDYTAPDGTIYEHDFGDDAQGHPTGIVGHGVTGPVTHGWQKITLTLINNDNHTYSVHDDSHGAAANAPEEDVPEAGLGSTAPEVQRQLQNGQLTVRGRTTVAGTRAIALQTQMTPATVDGSDYDLVLYVDARTYQPLRLVITSKDNPVIAVEDYEPATAVNIARAEDSTIPAGYTKVAYAG